MICEVHMTLKSGVMMLILQLHQMNNYILKYISIENGYVICLIILLFGVFLINKCLVNRYLLNIYFHVPLDDSYIYMLNLNSSGM